MSGLADFEPDRTISGVLFNTLKQDVIPVSPVLGQQT